MVDTIWFSLNPLRDPHMKGPDKGIDKGLYKYTGAAKINVKIKAAYSLIS